MHCSEDDLSKLKVLRDFLTTSFKGSSIGELKIDEATASLDRILAECDFSPKEEVKLLKDIKALIAIVSVSLSAIFVLLAAKL